VKLGFDPAAEKRERVRKVGDTFGVLAERFLGQYSRRPRTVDEVRRHLQKYAAPLNSSPVDSITLRDGADPLAKIDKVSGPVTANRVRASLSTMFSWAMREGLVSSNPIANTNKREERARDRVLSEDELRRIWNAADDGAYGTIVRLLLLTGQRRSEVSELRWSEVDFAKGCINLPAARTKNKRPHIVPLGATARALLENSQNAMFSSKQDDRVFEFRAWDYYKNILDKASGVGDWTLHDLRRTVATGMADIGIQPHIIEAVLNHVSGHKGGVAGIYNRSSYAAEKVAALTRWDEHVCSLVRS
jgi:integrase